MTAAHRAGLAALGDAPLDAVPAAVHTLDLAVLNGIAAHLADALASPGTAAEFAAELGAVPRHRWIVGRWLAAMEGEGLTARRPDGRYERPVRRRRGELIALRRDLDAARARLGYPDALTRYLLGSLRELPGLLTDRVSAQALLFPGGDFATADAAYRDNLVNRYLNAAAVEVVCALPRKRRVLELGAGTGSLTAALLPVLHGHTDAYLFTDLSPFFLDAARRRFTAHPFLRTAVADLDAPLAASCGAEPFDLVVAVNAAHNARDTGALLAGVRAALRPGGTLLLVETCHEHHQSLASMPFLLSAPPGGQRTVRTDVRAGTGRTYLTRAEWTAALGRAGFAVAHDLPDPGHPLAAFSQRLLAAVRTT
ncbi:class I SAM-dependent methyltransferase [Actinomadura flavalba]|uniref:class I SAM-dependent methyltransferase n=1 Tax=Actinomadura flavalba TaxID=1120938 RepID=UPI000382E272|nr:class I SAM-dependent methyltransferase [Actinomadura flavalba]